MAQPDSSLAAAAKRLDHEVHIIFVISTACHEWRPGTFSSGYQKMCPCIPLQLNMHGAVCVRTDTDMEGGHPKL